MKRIILYLLLITAFTAYSQDLIKYVNPFIGTGGHGHTYPGAIAPFGMVQLSPDTRLDGWDGCSAYHHSDSVIYGFSHTHLNGTGCSDYGDLLIMPITKDNLWKNTEYSSVFKHSNETAQPAYYSVLLDKFGIKAELTASERVGIHRYSFPANSDKKILIDLIHRDKVIDSRIEFINDTVIYGYRKSDAWANNQVLYFAIVVSSKIKDYKICLNDKDFSTEKYEVGKNIKAIISFAEANPLILKVGISSVSSANAYQNIVAEAQNTSFDEIKAQAQAKWNKELSKIIVEGQDSNKIKFYTALYHCSINPNIYSDTDGRYRGMDGKIHKADNYEHYTVFSLWDTYRAYHPLMTIINQKRTNDFINTFLSQYEQGGLLPVWELAANETYCMIGYHSIPVIFDAYNKGIRDYDFKKALDAMRHSANKDHLGLKTYKSMGYVSSDFEHESVSKTLEYCYDDWCIAQMSLQLGYIDEYKYFLARSQNYKNIFDYESGFMNARKNGGFYRPFEPTEVNNNFTEANSWQYSFYVPHDISGLVDLYKSSEKFENKLDELFTTRSKVSGRDQADITGLIGQYAHGNEPSHQIIYMYNYINKPFKTQKLAKQIMNTLYSIDDVGLCGNEDCGQMSAWFVMSAMGIYQVCPGDNNYAIGSPLFDRVTINLENGKKFEIITNQLSDKNIYIEKAVLDNKELASAFIPHFNIMNGGKIEFTMSSVPDINVMNKYELKPINEDMQIAKVPVIKANSKAFKSQLEISIESFDKNAMLFYSTDGTDPKTDTAHYYSKPFTIKETTPVKAIAIVDNKASYIDSACFFKYQTNKIITIISKYSEQYTAGGNEGLIDTQRGDVNFRLGGWQGYQGQDFECIIELDKIKKIKGISGGFLQDTRAWVVFPSEVEYFTSTDGINYESAGKVSSMYKPDDYTPRIAEFAIKSNVKAKFVKVKAKNFGVLPEWHQGAGGNAYIFIDEIVIDEGK